jgi:ubiquinone biosynthesis protein
VRSVCEPIFNRPLRDISFGQLLLRLFQTARRFNMEVQPQLVLLQKTLLNIEGLGRELYPDLDLWTTAKPFLEDWTREQMGLKATLRRVVAGLPALRELLLEAPAHLNRILQDMAENKLRVNTHDEELKRLREAQQRRVRHLYHAVAGGALIVSGTLLLALHAAPVWGSLLVIGIGIAAISLGYWAGGK